MRRPSPKLAARRSSWTGNAASSRAFNKSRRGFDMFRAYLDECPLIAIIRGVKPEEAEAIGQTIIDAGLRMIGVPVDSPDPLRSIERLSARVGDRALVGAGTVLMAEEVPNVRAAGGGIIVSPNTNPEVIAASVAEGLVSCPGYFTPTEAFTAIAAGATALKLFPAEATTPAVLKAHRALIPNNIPIFGVGGIRTRKLRAWIDARAHC